MLLPSLSMVFDGSRPLVKRCDGFDGSLWSTVYILYSPPFTHFLERWNVLAARRRHCGWDSVYMRAPLLGQLWVTALLPEGDQQPPATNNNHYGDEVAYCGNYHSPRLFWCWETVYKQMFSQQWAMGLLKNYVKSSKLQFPCTHFKLPHKGTRQKLLSGFFP